MGQRSGDVDPAKYRAEKIAEGKCFERYVAVLLRRRFRFTLNMSCKARCNEGENREGVEIKRDGLFRNSGNLYIEVAEKAMPRDGQYVPSGIYRNDNTRVYLIGDERLMWTFDKNKLIELHKNGRFREPTPKPTSKGFLLPVQTADKLCRSRIEVDEKEAEEISEAVKLGG